MRTAKATALACLLRLLTPGPAIGAAPSVDPPHVTADATNVMVLPGQTAVVTLVLSNNPGCPVRDVSWRAVLETSVTGCSFEGPMKGNVHLDSRSREEIEVRIAFPSTIPEFYECCTVTLEATETGSGTLLDETAVNVCPGGVTPVQIDPADAIPLLYWIRSWRAIVPGASRRFDAVIANQTNQNRTYHYSIESIPLDGAPLFTLEGKAEAIQDSVMLAPGGSAAFDVQVGVPAGTAEGSRNEVRFSVLLSGIPLAVSSFAYAGDFTTATEPATWGRIKALYR